MPILKVVHGRNPGQELPLDGASAVLGRHPSCQIKLEDASVSREHARITRTGKGYEIEDLGSRNGTFINGKLIEGKRPLADQDQIKICDLIFTFQLQATPPPVIPDGETTAPADRDRLWIDEADTGNSTIMTRLDVSPNSSGLRFSVRPEAKLRALIEISEHLGQALSLERVLEKTLDALFRIFVQADRGFVVLIDNERKRLIPKAFKQRRGDDETIRISRTVVDQVIEAKQAILSADAAADERFDMSQSIADFRIRSMMCAPLMASENHVLGVIQIDTLDRRSRFQQDDLDILASVARQAAFAIENAQLHETALRQQRIEYDLTLAHQVQQGLLPRHSPEIEGYDFFDLYEPANQLGGDYYDYISLPGNRLAVVVADVSGKGIAAALVMARLSSEVRYSLASEPHPARAIERLNAAFVRQGYEDRFVTMVLAVLDCEAHEITLVNAGHMAPLVRRKGGKVEPVGSDLGGLPLGIDDRAPYQQLQLPLARGESLVLFTDGVSEAMDPQGKLYGIERLTRQIAKGAAKVGQLGPAILSDVRQHVSSRPQSDDVCLVLFGRL